MSWAPHDPIYKNLRVADKTDEKLLKQLKSHANLADNAEKRTWSQYRQWRRMLIREALKRGLIGADPGGAP